MKSDADALAAYLCSKGIPTKGFYAEKANRDTIQKEWMDEEFPVLVATYESFGFGVIKFPLRFVFYYKLPNRLEDYVQASGRCRDKNYANVTSRIYYKHYTFKESEKKPIDHYVLVKTCRRKFIAEAFGENSSICEICDICRARRMQI